ncbi:MAG: hypothetical protein EXR62_06270 [Chloroflexi bacterium]|nr:hypothetical protein [Chloroflexota bacterium]
MSFTYNVNAMQTALMAQGYDTQVSDVIYGVRAEEISREVYIDQGGQVRFIATWTAGPPATRQATVSSHNYTMLEEETHKLTVRGQLEAAESLADFLADMETILIPNVR